MSDERGVPTGQTLVDPAAAAAPEVVFVERERVQPVSRHDTTIIRETDSGGSGMGSILPWLLGLLLIGGVLFMLFGGSSNKDGLDVNVDVAAPKMPEINLPDVNVKVDVPEMKMPELPKSDNVPAEKTEPEPKPQE